MAKVLVTGGAGYIGSHACKALAEAGHEPIVYDNLETGHAWAVKWGPLEVGDVLDLPRLEEAFCRHNPEAVMHFAAAASGAESVTEPAKYYRTNVSGTINLLEAMRAWGCRRMVFSSTCATYGVPEILPITEETPQRPINSYGASKLMVEQILKDYAGAYGLSSIALRYFNAAGADPDGELGEVHEPETHLIPNALEAALGQTPLTLYGDDYDTPDGTCVRDYVHVSDVAIAHVSALAQLEFDQDFRAYNLGVRSGVSVAEIVAAVDRVTGRKTPIRLAGRRAGDLPRLYADASRAAAELGWRPTLSDLDTIVQTAWRWQAAGAWSARAMAFG